MSACRFHGPMGTLLLALATAPFACGDDGEFTAEPPPDDLGAVCSLHSQCHYGCEQGVQGAPSYCTRSCADLPCPANYVCVSRGFLGLVCAMGYCSTTDDCPENYSCSSDDNVCRHNAIACTGDGDCPAATACNQGECATDCWSDDDCKQGHVCHHELGCVQCQYAADCTDGLGCIGGMCSPGCVQSTDCREGYECLDATCSLIQGGGPGQIGAFCNYDAHEECEWFCRHSECSRVCDGPEDTTTCPDGWECDPNHLTCRVTN